MHYISNSSYSTKKIGKDIAEKIIKDLKKKKKNKAFVVFLNGELGGGKTTFVQGFASAFGVKDKIVSPTFVIIKRYKISKGKYKNLYHIDCYRLNRKKDLIDLGFWEIINNSSNILLIEWADRLKDLIKEDVLRIKFFVIDKQKRRIVVE